MRSLLMRVWAWSQQRPVWSRHLLILLCVFFLNYCFIEILLAFWLEQVHALGHTKHQFSMLASWLDDNYGLLGFPALIAAAQQTWLFREDFLRVRNRSHSRSLYSLGTASLFIITAGCGLYLLRNDLFDLPQFRMESPFELTAVPVIGLTCLFGVGFFLYGMTSRNETLLFSGIIAVLIHLYWFTSPYYFLAQFTDLQRVFKPISISAMTVTMIMLFVALGFAHYFSNLKHKNFNLSVVVIIYQLIVMTPLWTALSFILPHHDLCLQINDGFQRTVILVLSALQLAIFALLMVIRKLIPAATPQI